MGRRGPPPTPTKILQQRGSWRAKDRDDNEWKPPEVAEAQTMEAPAELLALGPMAADHYRHTAPLLLASGVLTEADLPAFVRYCALYARWKKAEANVLEFGAVIFQKDRYGELKDFKRNPACLEANQLATLCLQLEREFGMTPSARVNMPGKGDDDAPKGATLEDFFSAG